MCLAALNITHKSNEVLINRLQRRVSIHLFAILEITFAVVIGNKKRFEYNWNIIIIPALQIYLNERSSKYTMGCFFQLYVNSRYAKPRFKKFGFEILDTGNMYLIRSPAGLKIQWFHTTGMMVIEMDSYNNRLPTMGLCGTKPITTDYTYWKKLAYHILMLLP